MGRKKVTLEEFKQRSNKIHENKYDYEFVEYSGSNSNVIIICPKHGKFEIRAESHLKGFGCKLCTPETSFISRANIIYHNFFDYSKIIYTRMCDPVEIICPVHNSFFITPECHLRGHGCKKCNKLSKT